MTLRSAAKALLANASYASTAGRRFMVEKRDLDALAAALSAEEASLSREGVAAFIEPRAWGRARDMMAFDMLRETSLAKADQILALFAAGRGEWWRPIESAPKDGTRVLLWTPDLEPHTIQAHWFNGWRDVWNEDPIESAAGAIAPTHWRLLPEAPPPPTPEASR